MKLRRELWMIALMGLLIWANTAAADVFEDFSGLSQGSYGIYTYNGFRLDSALCNAIGASVCVNPLEGGNAVRIRNTTSGYVSNLEYIGADGNGKDGGVGTISFDYKPWDGDPVGVYDVSYSVGGGAYNSIGTLNASDCMAYTNFSYVLNNGSDNIKIKISRTSGERLHVDNFSITDFGADLIPPEISSVTVVSATELDVLFSEDVDAFTAEIEANYTVTPGSVNPSSALRDGTNNALVHLTFAAAFTPDSYTLAAVDVEDLAGNPSNDTAPFVLNPTLSAGDVVINEIMYDDTASADVEWVEIYNRTANSIDIGGWILQDDAVYPPDGGEGAIEVPAATMLAAGGYLVLSKVELPEIEGEVVCTQYIGSFNLVNTGDNVALYTAATGGMLMDGTLDSAAWYPDLAQPGNSIEKCDENSTWSSDPADWHESTNVFAIEGRYRQCTPGAANSVCAPDATPPAISYLSVISTTELDVMFDEDLDQTTAETAGNYVVTPGSVSPSSATLDGTNFALVHLTFASPFAPGSYTLTANGVEDLNDNACVDETALFEITALSYGDVVITEIMYDDTSSLDSEWVEIHNTTVEPIDISGWYLTDDDSYPTPSDEGGLLVPESTILPAGGYLVLTDADQPELTGEIVCLRVGNFALNNTGDNLALYTAQTGGTLIDGSLTVTYPDLALANAGHSIEKCDVNATWSGEIADWHESTNDFGGDFYTYCTPGAVNSECVPDTDPPLLVAATGVTPTIVDVEFNEAVDQTTAETVTNYSVDQTVGNPSSAVRQGNPLFVRLTFGSAMTPGVYTLDVINVEDLIGNPMEGIQQDTFTIPEPPANLVITEIMPNPNFIGNDDSLGEWFEVYNAGETIANLAGWILSDNAGADTIEGAPTIQPGEYFVFGSNGVTETNGGVPVDYAYVFSTSGWGLSLNNSTDVITIKDASGTVVTTLTYTSAYPFGAGYSAQLEDVSYDPSIADNWCRCDSVWVGATNGDMGTPGAETICGVELPPQYRTLCDIREQDENGVPTVLNTQVITQGVVTYMDSCRQNAYIELNGCAVMIYGTVVRTVMQNSTRKMMVGDFVEVSGYIIQFNGLTEFSVYSSVNPVVTFISEGNPIPNPAVVQPGVIEKHADDCAGETYESRRIAVPGLTFVLGDGVATFSGGSNGVNYEAVSGTDTVVVRVVPCDSIVGTVIPVGPVSVMGLLGQYDNTGPVRCGGYQMMMAGANPFSVAVCATPVSATAYRLSGANADSVEIRWTPGAGQTCDCYLIYYTEDAASVFPAGYTLDGCVCGQTYYRLPYSDATTGRRFYVVTSETACP